MVAVKLRLLPLAKSAVVLLQVLKERALVPTSTPGRAQLLTFAFLAGVLITAVRCWAPAVSSV